MFHGAASVGTGFAMFVLSVRLEKVGYVEVLKPSFLVHCYYYYGFESIKKPQTNSETSPFFKENNTLQARP